MSTEDNAPQEPAVTNLSSDSWGTGTIVAAKPYDFDIVICSKGKPVVKITPKMTGAEFEISDDHIRMLVEKNPQAAHAVWALTNCVKDETLASTLRENLNNFFRGMITEFHKDIYEKLTKGSPGHNT